MINDRGYSLYQCGVEICRPQGKKRLYEYREGTFLLVKKWEFSSVDRKKRHLRKGEIRMYKQQIKARKILF